MFDPKCLELAKVFLADEPRVPAAEYDGLAQEIQDAIELWIEEWKLEHTE